MKHHSNKSAIQIFWHKYIQLWSNKKVLMIVLTLLFVGIFCGSIYYFGRLNNPGAIFNKNLNNGQSENLEIEFEDLTEDQLTDEEFLKDYIASKYYDKNIVTVVLLGFDTSEQRRTDTKDGFSQFKDGFAGARTDGIKLATINFDTNEASIISLPRDTYVPIADTGNSDKINAAYVYGRNAAIRSGVTDQSEIHKNGINYTLETLENLFSIPLDYYFCVDFDFIIQYIDYIGGIKFNVDHEIKLNGQVALEKKLYDPANGAGELNGTQAFIYMQDRKNIASGDFGRIQGHTEIILATLEHLKNNPGLFIKSFQFMNDIGFGLINTNLNEEQILSLANASLKVDRTNIKSVSIDGYPKLVNGIDYIVMKDESRVTILKDIFGIDAVKRDNLIPEYIVPETPLSLAGTYATDSIMLSWQPADKYNLKYNVYRNDELIASELEEPSFIDTKYIIGLNVYTVKAVNGDAVSEPTTIEVLTKFDVDTPWNIRASYNASSHIVNITWAYGDVADVKFAIVRTGSDGSTKTFDDVITTNVNDTTIVKGVFYTYQVTAVDMFGNESAIVSANVNVKDDVVATPTPVPATPIPATPTPTPVA